MLIKVSKNLGFTGSTAISFGARQNTTGWQNESGGWTNPALVDIIKNVNDRERFLADPTVQAYINEQGILDAHLYELVKVQRRDLLSTARRNSLLMF